MLHRRHTRFGRVIHCRPIIQWQVFLGEEPTETVKGWGVLVRWSDGRLSRLSSAMPMRRGRQVRVAA